MPVPFVTTGSATDVALAFALLPLWWALGLNQLVWAPLALFVYLKRTMAEKRLDHVKPATFIVVGVFVTSYLATAVVLWVNYPGFLGTSSIFYYAGLHYVAAALFLVLAADCAASSERERLRVIAGIGAMGLGACAAGALPYLGLNPSYEAPVRFLLPEGVASPQSGGLAIYGWSVERSLGSTTCFFGYEVFRPRSLFTYATLYAAAMAMAAPLQLYLAHHTRYAALRLLWVAAAALSVAMVLLTTSRTASAALVVAGLVVALGWAAWAFLVRRADRLRLLLGLLGTLCAGAALLATGPWAAGTLVSAAGLEECEQGEQAAARESLLAEDGDAASLIRAGVVEARGGSLKDRMEVYRATLERWPERPWFGFGTTRNSPDVRYPLGSLNMYLGTLFQRGAVGLAALLALMGYAYYRLVRGLLSRPGVHRPFLLFAAVSMLVGSMAGLADIFDLDATVQVLFWTLMGLVVGTSYATAREKGDETSASGRGSSGSPP